MTDQDINSFTMQISQASKTELVVVMYDIITKYIDDAVNLNEAGNFEGYRINLKKSRDFINSLISGLDMQYPISQELLRLYLFFNKTIVRAEINKKTEEVLRVRDMIINLREAFSKISSEDKSGPVLDNAQQVYSGLTYSKASLNENIYSDYDRGYKV